MANFEEVGVRAIVAGASAYVNDANRVNKATEGIGTSAQTAAKRSESLEQRMRSLGSTMEETGRRAVVMGTALAAVGTGSVFLASNFESAITKLHTLSGIALADLDDMREGILKISSSTAQGPQELVDALLVITSTGLRGAAALEVLENAAKGSAIGLGETKDVGRAIVSIMNAYAASNIDAARAANVLAVTAREGGAEVDEVANSMGRVVGIAATFGVKIEDVGAFIATFTRLGVDADEAVTSLRGALTSIYKPADETEAQLKELGSSSEELRQIVEEKGLIAAFERLMEVSKGDTEALGNLIPNIRALAGFLGTVGVQGDRYVEVQQAIINQTNALNEAFEIVSNTSSFKFQQAMADLQAAAIQLGTHGLPVLTKVAFAVSTLAKIFGDLPGPVQQGILYFTLFGGSALILIGTLGIVSGSLLNVAAGARALGLSLSGLNLALLSQPAGWALIAAGAAAAGVAYLLFKNKVDELSRSQQEEAFASREAANATHEQNLAKLQALNIELGLAAQKENLAKAALSEAGATDEEANAWANAKKEVERLGGQMRIYGAAVEQSTAQQRLMARGTGELAGGLGEAGAAADGAGGNFTALSDKAAALKGQIDGLTASALATKIILENIANIQGATFENILDMVDPGALQRQIESAGAKLKPILDVQEAIQATLGRVTNAAGRLTPEQQAAAKSGASAAESAAEKAAKEAEKAREDELKRIDQTIADAEAAAQRLREEESRAVDTLLQQVMEGLRRRATAEKDAANERLQRAKKVMADIAAEEQEAIERQRDLTLENLKQLTDLRVKSARDSADAEIAEFQRATDAQVRAIQQRIDALDELNDTEDRAELQRDVALAFDPNERADAEKALRRFDRAEEQERLRGEIKVIEDNAAATIKAREAQTDAEVERLEREAEFAEKWEKIKADIALAESKRVAEERAAGLDAEIAAVEANYKRQTSEFALQSEARRMIAAGEMEAIGKLLDEFVPEWTFAGKTYGEQLIAGLKASGVEKYINDLLAKVARISGGGAGGAAAAAAAAGAQSQIDAEIKGRQEQGKSAVEGGAPQSVIDQLREDLINMGAIPEFARGLDVGVVRRPTLASLDPGERVVTPDQWRDVTGGGGVSITVTGNNFNGSPEENGRAVREEIESQFNRQMGRDAHLWGVR